MTIRKLLLPTLIAAALAAPSAFAQNADAKDQDHSQHQGQSATTSKTDKAKADAAKGAKPAAKADLREIWQAPDRATAEAAIATFAEKYAAKYGKAVACLAKDRDALLAMCDAQGWRLAVDRLAYFSHWLTPPGMPRRFDTRFFIAEMPAVQSVKPDGRETVEHMWLKPADAVHVAGDVPYPTATADLHHEGELGVALVAWDGPAAVIGASMVGACTPLAVIESR